MRAWTVDADDIRVAEDFDESFLHRTPEIDSFLAGDRDDKFIVIGTKGFGKTLLLKAKRILHQRDNRGSCLPAGSLLDKPIGDKIFGRETLAFFAASPLPWSKVWLTAIALAVLKHVGAADGLKVNSRLMALVRDEQLRGVIDHFVRLLDFSPGDLQRCAADTDGHLVPRLRAIQSTVAIFVDGIDEYFNKHVEVEPSIASVDGEVSPNVWTYSQLGLVEVAYQLRRVNHHVKVFAAIRKEAYARLPRRTAMAQQYRGSAIDIVYSAESLREIFVNNVRLVKSDRMVRPARAKSHPLEAFLGRTSVTDTVTREEEDALEYLCRHTLLRPRDLMTIGERLSAQPPDVRRHEHAAEGSGQPGRRRDRAGIPGRDRADARRRRDRAAAAPAARTGADACRGRCAGRRRRRRTAARQALWALHRVGLLGYVEHDRVRGEWRQRFLRPGEAALDADGTLPPATNYLVHPVLTDLVGRLNPGYLLRVDRHNVIGYDRPWREVGRRRRLPGADAAGVRAESRRAGFRQPDARRRRPCGAAGAGHRGQTLVACRCDRRGPGRRLGADRRRRPDRAGADGAPPGRRRLPGAGPAAAARRAALRRGADAAAPRRGGADDRRRRRGAVRVAGRTLRRAGPGLGHRGIPPAVAAAAVAVADDRDRRRRRRPALRRRQAGQRRAGAVGTAVPDGVLSVLARV